jgi:hypothetical protein
VRLHLSDTNWCRLGILSVMGMTLSILCASCYWTTSVSFVELVNVVEPDVKVPITVRL